MTAEVVAPTYVPLPALRRARRVLAAVQEIARHGLRVRVRCLLLGHDDSFARGPRRLMLRCEVCGRETAGWAIGTGSPTIIGTSRIPPGRRVADTAVRVGPWSLQRRDGRGAARERERQRMVAAASRAGEQRGTTGPRVRLVAEKPR